jgi:hypothetical protein
MKTLATVTAALGLLGAFAAATPASAAMGQCFDAYGRPYGPPHNTDNPPYGMICQAYRAGGHCTHVQPGWAESNCGIAPRGRYNRGYDNRGYDYDHNRRYRQRGYYPPPDTHRTPQENRAYRRMTPERRALEDLKNPPNPPAPNTAN